jgi:hypothetical protein
MAVAARFVDVKSRGPKLLLLMPSNLCLLCLNQRQLQELIILPRVQRRLQPLLSM